MAAMSPAGEGTNTDATFEIPLAWPVDLASQAVPVNQALFAWDQDNREVIYVMLGHLGPPIWLSEEAAKEHTAQFGDAIPVQPRGSFIITRSRAEEIWGALGRHLGKLPDEQATQ